MFVVLQHLLYALINVTLLFSELIIMKPTDCIFVNLNVNGIMFSLPLLNQHESKWGLHRISGLIIWSGKQYFYDPCDCRDWDCSSRAVYPPQVIIHCIVSVLSTVNFIISIFQELIATGIKQILSRH